MVSETLWDVLKQQLQDQDSDLNLQVRPGGALRTDALVEACRVSERHAGG